MIFKLLVVPLCLISALAFASSDAGTDLQNGGGGILKDGHYMTFASAQIPIQQRPETMANIPGLKLLLNRISDLQLTSEIRNTLIGTTYPLKNRSYYRVDATYYDETLRRQILKNYLAMMAVPKNENIVLFAVTDVQSRTTFLLPEFYQLSEIEQAAILLHEAAWLIDPEQNYQNIVELELSAQAYFQKPQDRPTIFRFYKTLTQLLKSPKDLVYAMIKIQYPKGGKVHALTLFGNDFLQCSAKIFSSIRGPNEFGEKQVCVPLLVDFLLKKVISDANNIVFEALLESYSTDRFADPTNQLERIYLDATNDIDGKINRIISVEELQKFLTTLMIEMTPEEISDGGYMLPLSVEQNYPEPNYSLGQMVFQ